MELELPFVLRDRSGRVTVDVSPIRDSVSAGFDVLDGLPFGPDDVVGYPALRAEVAYAGQGYRAMSAWLQVLTVDRFCGPDAEPERWVGVDLPPVLDGVGAPFFCSGVEPTLFDAPARNLSGADRLTWTADTFLVSVPLRSRAEAVTPLTWFRWGYDEYADGRPPDLHPLLAVPPGAWTVHLTLLRRDFASWTFAEEPSR